MLPITLLMQLGLRTLEDVTESLCPPQLTVSVTTDIEGSDKSKDVTHPFPECTASYFTNEASLPILKTAAKITQVKFG